MNVIKFLEDRLVKIKTNFDKIENELKGKEKKDKDLKDKK
jgi:hypothetical protein